MFAKLLSHFSEDIAIDLGTANTLVYVRGRGIVIQEPSVVAINQKTGQVLAIGDEAKKMVGRTPSHIVAIRPLIKGVISDFEVTEQMLKYFIEKTYKRKILLNPRPRVIIGVPCGVTEVEKKAVQDATRSAGAREVYLIEQPMAAAIGARLPVQEAGGNFVVDVGGGTTEVAVISLGGLVISRSLRVAGDKLSDDIIQFTQEEYNLLIGERMAEEIKIRIGSAYPLKEKMETSLRGRNLVTGLPEEIKVSDEDVRKAMEKSIYQIVSAIKVTVEETPPELIADIMSRGIYLSGGGSLLRSLDTLIQKETKIPTKIIDDPLTAVVRGGGIVLENLDELKDILVETEELAPPH
ncbi:MAG: rod shape-determining protein [Candidatus Nealsonbacteria bacterium CG03_land_8_20_14_0_80_36_12]|uniref:Cell shape-determining protein MreB n=1 Tax=Candidatus Nealsonbacteria bacterium CG03_land_8_20_14_0_80_36_12 TaxID=1974701 RepID=A0A2M7BYF6_9BACT|nr:MAG: rod shape-determining protein [Candidatus Nealsonbacteria bacterium CG03_land_8_20_14_0_80_36_12]